MSSKKLKVLFLSAWYPNHFDPMWGLFVQRHAKAISLHCDLSVLYICPVNQEFEKKIDIKVNSENEFIEVRVYYKQPILNIPIISFLIKISRYFLANYAGYKAIKNALGKPELVHVNILTRTGILALYLKVFKKIPYIITEHWSRYLPATANYNGILRKIITKRIVKRASAVTTVTENLKNAMLKHGLKNSNYIVVPNVVNTAIFFPDYHKSPKQIKDIIHISCFEDKSKNISGILRVIKKLSQKRNDFRLTLVGEGMDFEKIKNYSKELEIDENIIIFRGLKQGKELADELRNADLMLMFSNYENMPVTINESFACGIPVITSNVGGIAEYVNSTNGILVSPGKEDELLEKLDFMLDNLKDFKTDEIRKVAVHNFSVEKVGEQFLAVYQNVLLK